MMIRTKWHSRDQMENNNQIENNDSMDFVVNVNKQENEQFVHINSSVNNTR